MSALQLTANTMFTLSGGEGVYLPGLYHGRLSNQLHCEFGNECYYFDTFTYDHSFQSDISKMFCFIILCDANSHLHLVTEQLS